MTRRRQPQPQPQRQPQQSPHRPPPPPLVAPGGPLCADERERYSRHIALPELGMEGQLRITAARVLVVGAGGLGSPVLLYLAAAGVGTIGIVDDDTVELSNLQRQVVHTTAGVGRAKVTSAHEAVRAVDPGVEAVEHRCRLTAENALSIVGEYDLVIDGADNFATRYLVSDAAALLGKPCVWGSILRFTAQVSVFWSAHGPTYRDLYPEPPDPGASPSCGEAGVLGMLCGIAGALMAAEAVKIVTGAGTSLLGRVAQYDALDARWEEFGLARDPASPRIVGLEHHQQRQGHKHPGGAAALPDEPVERITSGDLRSLLRDRDAGLIALELLDVRERGEHDADPLPGSRLLPLARLLQAPGLAGDDQEAAIVLLCQTGSRSDQGARRLAAAGYTNVRSLAGGATAWALTAESPER